MSKTETKSHSRKERREAERENRRRSKQKVPTDNEASGRRLVYLAIGIALLALLIFALRLDHVSGMISDDAWYLLLAKALATGNGYTLINAPTTGIVPSYPPGFPWLLSLVFRIAPDFPGNLWLLKSISILGLFGAAISSYLYFKSARQLSSQIALGIAAATVVAPVLVYFATSTVMSECVFTCVQMATFVAIEKTAQADEEKSWKYSLLAAVLASSAFLIRSIALVLLGAGMIYLLKVRRWRAAILFAALCALLTGPWVVYSRLHLPTSEMRRELGNGFIVRNYTEQFWDRVAGFESEGKATIGDLPGRFAANAAEVSSKDIGGMLAAPLFGSLNQGLAQRDNVARLLLTLALSLLVIIGFIAAARERITIAEVVFPLTLLLVIAWPFPTYRFVAPFFPLVLFYLFRGVRSLLARFTPGLEGWGIPTLAVWAVVALNLIANFAYLGRRYAHNPQQRPRLMRAFDETEENLRWAAANLEGGMIASENAALSHLYTGRKTLVFTAPDANWDWWKQLDLRFIVHTGPLPAPEPVDNRFKILHRAPGAHNLHVVDLGPTESRAPWSAQSRSQ